MALVIGVDNGDTFLIGRRQVEVVLIVNRAKIILKRDDGEIFTVRRHLATEVFNGVFISTGPRLEVSRRARLVFNAPRSVRIQRCAPHQSARAFDCTFT
jgi:hypothetical protein